jgi:carbon-monoxide dehydrogenase small subunit
MLIKFRLNNNEVEFQAEPNERLIDILRKNFNLKKAKSSCNNGLCGACTVFFNNMIMPSCLIPAFRVKGSEVITLEGFEQTNEYKDILEGFKLSGVENCGYCTSGKILITESLLRTKNPPEKKDILSAFDSVKCRCTDAESLVKSVTAAYEIRNKRQRHAERQ